ncbi:CIC11C00000003095 [Sungouiella intermedia]|uniref:CIC11C00000003095 n=1 Tax=Sungouiella intermedia TaxID=45354 RepID=A0A1L0FWW6_9ASCO|nr:CIC11C00000003095 [[Candida] intermedia]
MSLFRSLQNSPATISIFHYAKQPASAKVYATLEKAYFRYNENKNQFQIDLNAKKMPTYDQFKDIYSHAVHGEAAKTVIQTCFPLLSDKKTSSLAEHFTTFKSLGVKTDRGFKIFSENEYVAIQEAFSQLVNESEPEIDPTELFRAPLVVDWDQNLIACDEDGLETILAKYKAAADEK